MATSSGLSSVRSFLDVHRRFRICWRIAMAAATALSAVIATAQQDPSLQPQIRTVLDEVEKADLTSKSTVQHAGLAAWIGPCHFQGLPYLGSFNDGTSAVWWGGRFDQPNSGTCVDTTGYYYDFWTVPAQPGDVFDIVFGGAYNTYLALSDYSSTATAYVSKYATLASTSGPEYIAGWIGFTIPSNWTNGYFSIWVSKNAIISGSSIPLTLKWS